MRPGPHTTIWTAARFYTPLILIFASTLLLVRAPGTGVGLAAGFACVLALMVHALVYGSDAARVAAPPGLMRGIAALGLIAAFVGVAAPRLALAAQLAEAGAFLATAASGALILSALFGRAPTMRDEP